PRFSNRPPLLPGARIPELDPIGWRVVLLVPQLFGREGYVVFPGETRGEGLPVWREGKIYVLPGLPFDRDARKPLRRAIPLEHRDLGPGCPVPDADNSRGIGDGEPAQVGGEDELESAAREPAHRQTGG